MNASGEAVLSRLECHEIACQWRGAKPGALLHKEVALHGTIDVGSGSETESATGERCAQGRCSPRSAIIARDAFSSKPPGAIDIPLASAASRRQRSPPHRGPCARLPPGKRKQDCAHASAPHSEKASG